MGKKGEGRPTGGRPTKTRRKLLTWLSWPCQGTKVVSRLWLETEVIGDDGEVRVVPAPRVREKAPDTEVSEVRQDDSWNLPLPFEPAWLDNEDPAPPGCRKAESEEA